MRPASGTPEASEPRAPELIGYARASMTDQRNKRQFAALLRYGVSDEAIFSDSRKAKVRRGWNACMAHLDKGDVLVVHSLDRIGHNFDEIIQVCETLRAKQVTLRVICHKIDTATPAGRRLPQMLALASDCQRAWVLERSMTGLRATGQRGIGGRKRRVTDEQIEATVLEAGGPDTEGAFAAAATALDYHKVTILRRWKDIKKRRAREAVRS